MGNTLRNGTLRKSPLVAEQVDPIFLSDTSDEEAMPRQTKRRGITKKHKVVDAPPKQKTRGSLHKNTIGQLRCHQDSNASDIEDESNNEDAEDDDDDPHDEDEDEEAKRMRLSPDREYWVPEADSLARETKTMAWNLHFVKSEPNSTNIGVLSWRT